jgi:hypothetical protein
VSVLSAERLRAKCPRRCRVENGIDRDGTSDGKQFKTKPPKIDAAERLIKRIDPTGKKILYGTV